MPVSGFKDYFSGRAAAYAAYRPRYPSELTDFLAEVASSTQIVWDCGCGSGQLSVDLTRRFTRVVATDASAQQLSQAVPHPRVEYRHAAAERSGLPEASVGLAVAAQAAHWFDLPSYYDEVRRVVEPRGGVALVTYAGMSITPEVDLVLHRFHTQRLGPYWPPERRWTEDGYRSLPFPFAEVDAPRFEMRATWTLKQLLGYINTWSAVRALEAVEGEGVTETLQRMLAPRWGEGARSRLVRWPVQLRVGRV